MKTKSILVMLMAIVVFAASCKKTENNYYCEDAELVSITLSPKELVVESSIPLKAQVSRTDAEGFQFTATKPSVYYAYFIVGNEVIHKFDQLTEGSQQIQVQNRAYDKIIVSSIEVADDVLRNYNNANENLQKLVYSLPVTSDKLILVGEVYGKDIRQDSNVTVVVQNYHAVAIFFNAATVKTQDDVALPEYNSPVKHHLIYIKNKNAMPVTANWQQGFKYTVGNVLFNTTASMEANRVYKFFIQSGLYDTTDGNFTVVVGELFVKPVKFKDLPGNQ